MKVVTAEEMRQLERHAAEVGLPQEVLMEKAGLAVAEEVSKLRDSIKDCSILVLVGPGNNGGDGLVAARHLHDWGARVQLLLFGERAGDRNFELALERGIPSTQVGPDVDPAALRDLFSSTEVVIDALLGTGKLHPIEGTMKQALHQLRGAKQTRPDLVIVALDLPSGLDADSGRVDPACPRADITVTLGYPKLGLFAFPGAVNVGRLVIADIGLPAELAEDIATELITSGWVKASLPERPPSAHKGTFGKVLVVAGSINYIGAAYLACMGACRVGAGLVTLATAESLQPILASKLTEVTYLPLPQAGPGIIGAQGAEVLRGHLPDYDVLLLGCGLGQHPPTREFIKTTLSFLPPALGLVLDADALNTLAQLPDWWQKLTGEAVLTPHPGEMARLTGLSIPDIQRDRLKVTREKASQWQKVVVLKGAHTVVASPQGQVKLSPWANPGLASAGMGDVLSGAIAGLLAQGLAPLDAAACGVYLHSLSGEIARESLGDAGILASDLLPYLPQAIRRLKI